MTYSTLVAPEALAANDDDWAIVDARFHLPDPDRGEAEYLEAHIPGAVYAHLDRDLSGPVAGSNGRHPMPSVEQMVDRFSQWGIDDHVQVVVYDGVGGQIAARLWWMLRYLGHDDVAVVDGGLSAYGGKLRGGREQRAPRSFTPKIRDAMRIDLETLVRVRGDRLLIDARATDRFHGENETLDPVAGHIPGAKSLPCSSNLKANGRFAPVDELAARFKAVVEDRDPTDIVSYCGSGVTACHNLLAMELAGIRGARLYPGSWSEWCADRSRPIETT